MKGVVVAILAVFALCFCCTVADAGTEAPAPAVAACDAATCSAACGTVCRTPVRTVLKAPIVVVARTAKFIKCRKPLRRAVARVFTPRRCRRCCR